MLPYIIYGNYGSFFNVNTTLFCVLSLGRSDAKAIEAGKKKVTKTLDKHEILLNAYSALITKEEAKVIAKAYGLI